MGGPLMGDFFMRVPRPTDRATDRPTLSAYSSVTKSRVAHSATARSFWGVPTLSLGHSLTRAPPSGTGFFSRGGRYLRFRRLFFLPLPLALLVWDPFFMPIFLTDGRLLLVAWAPKFVGSFGGFTVVVVSGIYKQKLCEGNKDVKHTMSLKNHVKKAGGASDAFFVPTLEFFPSLAKDPFYPPPFERAVFCVLKRRRGGGGGLPLCSSPFRSR